MTHDRDLKALLWTNYMHWLLVRTYCTGRSYCTDFSEKLLFSKELGENLLSKEFKTPWKRANSSELLLHFHKQLETNFIRFFFFQEVLATVDWLYSEKGEDRQLDNKSFHNIFTKGWDACKCLFILFLTTIICLSVWKCHTRERKSSPPVCNQQSTCSLTSPKLTILAMVEKYTLSS